jgi:2-alkenal reductase
MNEQTFINKKRALIFAVFALALGLLIGFTFQDYEFLKTNQNQKAEEVNSKDTQKEELYQPQLTHEQKIIETTEKAIEGVVAIETTDQTVAGSGFFISKDGYVLTNRHVVSDPGDYYVITNDGEKLEAEIVDRDPLRDLAFLKVEGSDFHKITLGNSDSLRLGQTAIAIGYSLGQLKNSVSVGVVSGLVRDIWARSGWDLEQLKGMIQTDAAINPGNSGGPLLNLKGEVIGINTAKSFQGDNVGFALPINKIIPVINSVLENGKIVNPFLGVRYLIVDEYEMEMRGLPIDYGALILRGGPDLPAITPDSPANRIGLREGDIITKLAGEKITIDNPLSDIILQYSPGDQIEVEYMRGKETFTKMVELAERPSD